MEKLLNLPFSVDFNRSDVLAKLSETNYKIGELNGLLRILPNPAIMLSLIQVSESKSSSAIENILSTYDDIFKAQVSLNARNEPAKEILNYRSAIETGFRELKQNGFISTNSLVQIQSEIEPMKPGIRRIPGTVVLNTETGEVVHRPPQSESEIRSYLENLERYINLELDAYDPLIRMALIHFQFECIHPFYDGNGRTGRILNILYLVLKEKISQPILFLSAYLIQNRNRYYQLIKAGQENPEGLVDFVLFMLEGLRITATGTVRMIENIQNRIEITQKLMKESLPEIYRYEIVEHLFKFPVTNNRTFCDDLGVTKNTATRYLKALVSQGFLTESSSGKEVLYRNPLLDQIYND